MTEKRFIGSNGGVYLIEVEEAFDLINKLGSENKKLKKENLDLSEELDYYKAKCASLETGLFQVDKENEQLKQKVTHLTMYKKLFKEFQKQLDSVKKKSDLDHKDFEDLIELTNGHVFDDVYGWIWLPVNDR